jgi:hypothetical protein
MRVDDGRGKLYDAHKTVRLRWEEAQTLWRDANMKDFEERVWQPLDMETAEMLQAIDRLNQLFRQVRNDCEGEK